GAEVRGARVGADERVDPARRVAVSDGCGGDAQPVRGQTCERRGDQTGGGGDAHPLHSPAFAVAIAGPCRTAAACVEVDPMSRWLRILAVLQALALIGGAVTAARAGTA